MKDVRIIFTFLLLTLFAGCTRENTSDCNPANVTLRLSYVYRHSANMFTQEVDNVRLFIYDMSGNLVRSVIDTPVSQTGSTLDIYLEPGDYRFVCWGNLTPLTTVNEQPTHGLSSVYHTDHTLGAATNGDPLYYAPRIRDLSNPDADMLTATIPATGNVIVELDFTAAHKTIEVAVKGYRDSNNEPNPLIECTGLSSGYDFSLQALSGTQMTYGQQGTIETRATDYSVVTFNTPLFESDTATEIRLVRKSDNTLIETISLSDYLTQHGIELTHGDWDKISILIEFNDLGVIVDVRPW